MHELLILYLDELKQSIKNKKIILLLLIYFSLMIFGLKKLIFLADAWKLYLAINFGISKTYPFALMFFYFLSFIILPLFIIMLTYDSISGEFSKSTIRYLTYRTKRSSIFLAKLFASIKIIAISTSIILIYTLIKIHSTTKIFYLKEGLLFWAYLLIYSFYFISLGFLSSSITRSSTRSLFIGIFLTILPLFFLLKDNLKKLSPYNYMWDGILFATENIKQSLLSISIIIGSSIIFLAISYIIFKRQDL